MVHSAPQPGPRPCPLHLSAFPPSLYGWMNLSAESRIWELGEGAEMEVAASVSGWGVWPGLSPKALRMGGLWDRLLGRTEGGSF